MTINANDHPLKVVKVEEGGPYANDHPYKVEFDGEGDYATKEELEALDKKVDALASDLSYKGTVASYADLPANPNTADTYLTEDTGILYVWSGEEWIALNESLQGLKVLTTADYDYPTNNPNGVALWKLPDGLYQKENNQVKVYSNNATVPTSNGGRINALINAGFFFFVSTDSTNSDFVCIRSLGFNHNYDMILDSSDVCPLVRVWKSQGGVANNFENGGRILSGIDIKDRLDSTSIYHPLSANQGKVLNEKIENRVQTGNSAPTTSTVGVVGQLYEDTTNGKLYQCTAIDNTDPQNPSYTWTEVGAGGGGDDWFLIQQDPTTHYITTTYDELEAAVNSGKHLMITDGHLTDEFNNTKYSCFGFCVSQPRALATSGTYSSLYFYTISQVNYPYCWLAGIDVLTYNPTARTITRDFGVGQLSTSFAESRNNSFTMPSVYSILAYGGDRRNLGTTSKTNLVSAINEVNTNLNARVIQNAGTPTTATVGTVGQLLEDTTNGKVYICTDATGGVYTWVEVGAGGGGVQTLTTDDYNYPTNNPTQVALWMLPQGFYKVADGVKYSWQSGQSNSGGGASVIVSDDFSHSSGTKRKSILVVPKNEPLFYSFVDWSSGQSVSTLSGYSGNTILNKSNINGIISPSGSYNAYLVPSTSALLTWTGLLSNLTTTDKTDLVSAINEVKGEIGTIATALHAINNGGES